MKMPMIKKYIFYLSVICIILSGCATEDDNDFSDISAENNSVIEPNPIPADTVTDNEFSSYTSESDKSSEDDITITIVSSDIDYEYTNPYNDFGAPVASIDLNYDGVPEDFFIGKDEYGDDEYIIVMDNGKDYHNNIQIPRTELINVYREDYSQSDEPPDYRYWFTYICGFGVNKCIEISPVYTGSEKDKSLTMVYGMGYYTWLAPYIAYDKKIGEEGFFELINNPHYFFKKYQYFDFVESISLEDCINSDCKQTYLSSIAVIDEMPEIQIYSLENDVFGKKYKFTNEKYSYFTDEFDSIELFERYADVAVRTMLNEKYDIIPRNEKDYLICLKNSNEDIVVLLYLGTASECYLFQYGAEGVEYKSYMENPEHSYKTYLENDGWLFVKQIEVA